MIKRGEGALTLGGSNNLDWRVEEGALVARAAGFGGNVEIGAAGRLTFDAGEGAGTETIYPYALSGHGRFEVKGTHMLVPTGPATFSGPTEVADTDLRVACAPQTGKSAGRAEW